MCPLTKKALPEDSLETAVMFGAAVPSFNIKSCGHACTMEALIDFLEEGGVKCPECETSHVISICDVKAAESLMMCGGDDEESSFEHQLIAFRYGSRVFWLTVPEGTTAQDRIAQVLGIKDCLQVLHHGKTVCPDESKSEEDISNNLIGMSKSEKGKKPSLVIMGKRTGRWGAQGGHVHR